MNRMQKLVILLLLISCIAVFDASAEEIAIKAEDGTDLPASIYIDETFTVLITADGVHVGAGTNVVFTLPQVGGDPIYVPTDADGKARYKPLITGTLQIEALDGVDTVAEATVNVVTAETQALDRVEISPKSADLLIGATEQFTATCYATDATGGGTIGNCTLTWACDSSVVGTIDSSGLFTAGGVGTATVTVTATYEGATKTNTSIVNVSAPTETVSVDGDNFTDTSIDAGTAADIAMNGTFDNNVTGSIDITPISDPEGSVGSYEFTGNDQALIGLTVTPDANITAELADGNDTIRIEICYNATELSSKDISPSTLAIWRFDGTEWVKMVAGTDPCVANGRQDTCVWIEVNNLSTFALAGTTTSSTPSGGGSGGGGGGTYPPDWFETPTPTVTPASSTATATATATAARTAKQAATKKPTVKQTTAAQASGSDTTPDKPAKKGLPGFGGVFAIAGLLAITYVMMRRKR